MRVLTLFSLVTHFGEYVKQILNWAGVFDSAGFSPNITIGILTTAIGIRTTAIGIRTTAIGIRTTAVYLHTLVTTIVPLNPDSPPAVCPAFITSLASRGVVH
ncbi:hypothetical protein CHS0354_040941 [Potamilus streckersoni]|uniref:Uncharacterized protein n=1 Tax=Potamilus streckersoni TaxID=2493646 RepID=A0AAE0W7V1_9BIVA|nr:hypothetical protein CHS0354_040941 [Potamilus streckersoni]